MRAQLPRDFYYPNHAAPVDGGDTDATVFTYDKNGKSYAIGFHGKASKPDWHHRFRNSEQRQQHITNFIQGRRERAEMMIQRKTERTKPHSFEIGNILYTSWGYDQTNIEFFEVTRVIGARTVELREIKQRIDSSTDSSERVVPVLGEYVGEPLTKRVNNDACKMRGWGCYAHQWGGQPVHQTALGCGH